jgi:hypothetical protein
MVAEPRAGKPHVVATEMTIVNPSGGPGLYGDGRGQVAPNLYVDASLPGGDPCALGSVNQTGYTVFDPGVWYSGGAVCNATLPQNARRTYTFSFPAADNEGPCTVLLGVPPGTSCAITADDLNKERIVLSGLFVSRAATTSVELAVWVPGNPQGYSLHTDGSAAIVQDSNPAIRTAVYAGTAKLYPIVNGSVSSTPATSSFTFPLQIRVQEGS